jgi:hypothetical protein
MQDGSAKDEDAYYHPELRVNEVGTNDVLCVTLD